MRKRQEAEWGGESGNQKLYYVFLGEGWGRQGQQAEECRGPEAILICHLPTPAVIQFSCSVVSDSL